MLLVLDARRSIKLQLMRTKKEVGECKSEQSPCPASHEFHAYYVDLLS